MCTAQHMTTLSPWNSHYVCFIFFPFTMHNFHWNVHNFSSLSPIDLALFHIHIPFIVKWHRTILIWDLKDQQSAMNNFFLQRTWSFSFSPFFDLWHSIWTAKDFNARSCEKMSSAEHHDPFLAVFHLLDKHASSRMLWERKSFFFIFIVCDRECAFKILIF
jgi:hypothetical protein